MEQKDYLIKDKFENLTDIKLSFNEFKVKKYSQFNQMKFVENLSIIDVVANLGWINTEDYVKSQNSNNNMKNNYNIKKNEYGFFQIDPTPTPEEIKKFYAEHFYSENYKFFNDSSLKFKVLIKSFLKVFGVIFNQ